MTRATRRLIREGEILPTLTLAGSKGPWRVPGPGNQASLLVFVHPGQCGECARYLTELGGAVGDLRDWATRLLGVLVGDDVADSPPFRVLRDERGSARERLGIGDDKAAIILADRWGEVVEVATFGEDHGLPLPRQLVESAKILDVSCGECNVPGAEWRRADA